MRQVDEQAARPASASPRTPTQHTSLCVLYWRAKLEILVAGDGASKAKVEAIDYKLQRMVALQVRV